tara:strand:+ start:1339 stop:1932 length:594 start_codon:yes stop_codon:yes gene_type:complete
MLGLAAGLSGPASLPLLAMAAQSAASAAAAPLVPLHPGGSTDGWCGWSAGNTPEAGQMYLALFFTFVLMRDAQYEAFGPLFYPVILLIFLTCIMPNIDFVPPESSDFNSFRPSTWVKDSASSALLTDVSGVAVPVDSKAGAGAAGAAAQGSWSLGPEAHAAHALVADSLEKKAPGPKSHVPMPNADSPHPMMRSMPG